MPLRNPKNQIKNDLYTGGGEFVYKTTGLDYIGYYHIINNKAYAGRDQFSSNFKVVEGRKIGDKSPLQIQFLTPVELDIAPALLPEGAPPNFLANIGNVVGFFTDAYSFAKSNLDTAKSLAEKYIPSKVVKPNTPRQGLHYFTQNKLDTNKVIKEVEPNDVSLSSLQQDPTYIVVQIDFSAPDSNQQIEEGDKKMPGLKTFINL